MHPGNQNAGNHVTRTVICVIHCHSHCHSRFVDTTLPRFDKRGKVNSSSMAESGNNSDFMNNFKESTLTALLKRSIKAKEHSHSPYSKFRVGAALLTDTGEIIDGCNVENASYGLSICAERTALVKAVSMGFKKFPAIAVTTDMEEFIAPCGACRQVIAEFGLECDVYLVKSDLSHKKMSVSELLPLTFTSAELERASLKQ